MAEQLQAMIAQYSAKCSTLSMCPEDCKTDVTNAFTTCGPCLAGAEQLAGLEGLMTQKASLESALSQEAALQAAVDSGASIEQQYNDYLSDPGCFRDTTGEFKKDGDSADTCDYMEDSYGAGQVAEKYFESLETKHWRTLQEDPNCDVATDYYCGAIMTSAEMKTAWRALGPTLKAKMQQIEQAKAALSQMAAAKAGLQQVTAGIQQLQAVQQSCQAAAPSLNTLHNKPVELPQGGNCLGMVQRFGILKEVMTARANGNTTGLSAGALEMLRGIGAQGQSVGDGALQNNFECVTSIDLTAGKECTQDSQCSSGQCAEGTTHNLNTRHCFRINNHNSENCLAANDSGNQYPGHCNRCKSGYGWDSNWKCVPQR